MNPIDPKKNPSSNEDKSFYTKLKETFHIGNDQFTMQVIVYVLLVIGVTCLLFAPFIGGLILGAIIGFAFADEIYRGVIRIKESLEHYEVLRSVILGVLCLAILIAAPGFVIGAVIAVIIKKIVHIGESTTEEKEGQASSKTYTQTIDIPVVKPEIKPETKPGEPPKNR